MSQAFFLYKSNSQKSQGFQSNESLVPDTSKSIGSKVPKRRNRTSVINDNWHGEQLTWDVTAPSKQIRLVSLLFVIN